MKANPNPHIPLTQVHWSKTQQILGESSPLPTGVQGREDGEKWEERSKGKTAAEVSKSNRPVLFLSPSANLTSCGIYIKCVSEHRIFLLDHFSAFALDGPVVSVKCTNLLKVFVTIVELDNNWRGSSLKKRLFWLWCGVDRFIKNVKIQTYSLAKVRSTKQVSYPCTNELWEDKHTS